MFTYKNVPYKILSLGPKFCWADPEDMITTKDSQER